MSLIFHIILICSTVLFFIFVVLLVTRSKLQVKYALLWMATSFVFILLAVFPGLVTVVTRLLHTQTESNTLFMACIFLLMLLCFIYNLILSKQSRKIRNLIQETSLLKARMDQMEQSMENREKERGI